MLIICAQQRFMEPALQAPIQGSSLENIGRLTVEIYLCLNIFVLFFFGICLVLFCFAGTKCSLTQSSKKSISWPHTDRSQL